MPSFRHTRGGGDRTKPWLARVRLNYGPEKVIGYFATEEEALCAEYDYGRPLPKGTICSCEICQVTTKP